MDKKTLLIIIKRIALFFIGGIFFWSIDALFIIRKYWTFQYLSVNLQLHKMQGKNMTEEYLFIDGQVELRQALLKEFDEEYIFYGK